MQFKKKTSRDVDSNSVLMVGLFTWSVFMDVTLADIVTSVWQEVKQGADREIFVSSRWWKQFTAHASEGP